MLNTRIAQENRVCVLWILIQTTQNPFIFIFIFIKKEMDLLCCRNWANAQLYQSVGAIVFEHYEIINWRAGSIKEYIYIAERFCWQKIAFKKNNVAANNDGGSILDANQMREEKNWFDCASLIAVRHFQFSHFRFRAPAFPVDVHGFVCVCVCLCVCLCELFIILFDLALCAHFYALNQRTMDSNGITSRMSNIATTTTISFVTLTPAKLCL